MKTVNIGLWIDEFEDSVEVGVVRVGEGNRTVELNRDEAEILAEWLEQWLGKSYRGSFPDWRDDKPKD